ncbi:MAG TPA: rubrerythrin family protein [Prolixibacteraceae bacterium]
MRTIFRFILFIIFAVALSQCKSSKPVKSIENLKTAINSEATSSEKYAKFAQKAMEEGYDTIAKLFDATSKSEKIHAFNLGKVLEKYTGSVGVADIGSFEVKNTLENLQTAINGETYEMQTMYPGFIRVAEGEKAPEAGQSFTWAWGGEKGHLSYYRQVEASIAKGSEKDLPFEWYVCPTCGNIYNPTNLKASCDFCLTKKVDFIGYTEE